MARAPATLILMTTRDRLSLLQLSLEALCTRTPECHRVLVVDNGSSQDTLSYLEQKLKRGWISTLIRNPSSAPQWQKSFAIVQAFGVLKSGPHFDHFAWIDSDVEVKPGWLTAAKLALSRLPDVDICSVHNDQLQEKKHPTVRTVDLLRGDRVRMKNSANGALWVMRRGFFKEYGLPPIGEGSGPQGVEDFHYSRLSQARGKQIAVLEGFSVHHGYDKSSRLGAAN